MPSRARIILIILPVLLLSLVNVLSPVLADSVVVTTCTGPGLQAAWTTLMANGGGTMTFNCGGATTIPVTTTLNVDGSTGTKNVTIDGGGLITLDGQNARRIFLQNTWGSNNNTLTLQNLTIQNALASGAGTAANGGAIRSRNESATQAQRPILNIDNVTFTNNTSTNTSTSSYDYGGGAIFSQGGFVNVTDSTFTNNHANGAGGAAIHILQSGLTIANTTFTNNIATHQGGTIYVDGLGGASGVFSIADSTFTGSRSWFSGGAIYVNMYENTSSMIIDRTSFIDNGVNGGTQAQGGAIAGGSTTSGGGTGNAIIRITNSLFSDNFVDRPGALDGSGGAVNFNQRAQVTIANSTFDGNRAEGGSFGANGGAIGIINNTTQFQIINSTITNNFAGWAGGGLFTSTNGRLQNTIVAYNTAANGGNPWNILQNCTQQLLGGSDNLQYPPRNPNDGSDHNCTSAITIADPLLAPLLNYGGPTMTRSPQDGSPAIDNGSNTVCADPPINNLDQRGMARPIDGDGLNGAQCDSGAFEYVSDQDPLPFNLTAPANGGSVNGTTATLSWSPSPFATQYHLLVDDDADFSSPVVDTITAGLSFTPPYIGVGLFHWEVEASNINGNVTSATQTFTLNSSPAAAPTRNFTTDSPQTLTWNPVLYAIGYAIEVATDPLFGNIVANTAALPAGTLSFNVSLPPGTYYWHVKGKVSNSPEAWGPWSGIETFTVGSP